MNFGLAILWTLYFVASTPSTASAAPVDAVPIIGVLSVSPVSQTENPTHTYIYTSYLKWLEANNLRWLQISMHESEQSIRNKLSKVDGALLPGGSEDFGTEDQPSVYSQAVKVILTYAMSLNDEGTVFPVFATCLGFQSMLVVLSDFRVRLDSTPNENFTLPVNLHDKAYTSGLSLIFGSKQLENIAGRPVFYFHHKNGFLLSQALSNEYIKENIDILGDFTTNEGVSVLGIFEHKRYPFLAAQFHVEKVLFEHADELDLNKSDFSVYVNNRFGRYLAEKLRAAKPKIDNKELLSYRTDMIVISPSGLSDEAYVFPIKGNEEQSEAMEI